MSFYGIDIVDFHRGKISARKLCILIDGLYLKEDSELYKKTSKKQVGEIAEWSLDRIFQAQLINELKLSNYYYLCAHKGEDQADIPKPKLIKLPGAKELTPQEKAQAEVDEFTQSVREIPVADLATSKSFFGDLGRTSAVPPIPIPGQ